MSRRFITPITNSNISELTISNTDNTSITVPAFRTNSEKLISYSYDNNNTVIELLNSIYDFYNSSTDELTKLTVAKESCPVTPVKTVTTKKRTSKTTKSTK